MEKKKKQKSSAFYDGPSVIRASSIGGTVSQADIKNLSNITNSVFDNCCFLIICSRHEKIMLTKGTFKFFPFVPLTSVRTWYDASIEGALYLLNGLNGDNVPNANTKNKLPFKKFICMQIFRFQLPQTQRFVTRLIYFVQLDPDSNMNCCRNTNGCKWFPIQDAISSKISNVWGPEVSYFTNIALSNQPIFQTIVEFSLTNAFKYIPRENPVTQEEQIINCSNVSVNDIERLYADFVEHTFPSFFLTRDSFVMYMQKHEIESNLKLIHRYYSAFRFRSKQYMQFHELLLGLASIDARTTNCEARVKLVFRYYDYDKDGRLNYQEFRRMVKDINAIPTQKLTEQTIRNEMKKIGTTTIKSREYIEFDNFKRAVNSQTFRGTTKLCRAAVSPFGQITRSLATRKLCKTVSNANLKNILQNKRYEGTCSTCNHGKPYEIATNLVVLSDDGSCAKFKQIFPAKLGSRYSLEVTFNGNSMLHILLSKIREFNKDKGNCRNYRGLFSNVVPQQLQTFYDDIKDICCEVGRIIENEDRVLRINDPAYVIGDIHGNLEDLLTLETNLWKSVPFLTCNYLFLGDYVDRGRWGFECFLYLMIIKLLAPNKIFLLRGNHEVRSIQIKYSFHKELLKKYGTNYGQRIFDSFNYVFDRLPFSAIINNSIFGAHGGIPYTIQDLEKLNNETPKCVQDPELEAISVWEIVWADPMEYSKFGEIAEVLGMPINAYNGGYLPNVKRGTSYVFNEFAVSSFLKLNGLSHIIRAHEVPVCGFKFNFGTSCTTIFSCSHYCGADNECSVVLIDRDGRMRVVRIDTSNNAPATNNNG